MVIEKPFGYDLASARQLNAEVLEAFDESQVFRIDHYLGKETVQNLMALRFANALFEPVWNRNYIDNVQITAAEDIGIEGRAGYYEGAGRAARPRPEPHAPAAGAADDGAPERVRGQPAARREGQGARGDRPARRRRRRRRWRCAPSTAAGVVGGKRCPATARSRASRRTRAPRPTRRCALHVSNWRWAGVPFYLRTGKRLPRKLTEIAVTLKPVPHLAFQSAGSVGVQPNQIILTVQPDEGVSVSLGAKIPGPRMRIRPVNMEFHYGTSFVSESPEAYERLILDAMRGDATLFTRNDEIEALWGIIDPILTAWREDTSSPIPQYPAGSAGPAEAESLLEERHGGGCTRDGGRDAADERRRLGGRDTTPDAIEAALRGLLRERHAANRGARAGAGPEPGGGRRPRVEGGDRQPPGAGRPLPRFAHDPVRGRGGPRNARRASRR